MALFVDYDDCSGGVAVLLEVGLRHWEAFGVPVGRYVVLLADAAVVLLRRCSAFMMCLLPAACCLTYDFC